MLASVLLIECFGFWRIVPPTVFRENVGDDDDEVDDRGLPKSVKNHPLLIGADLASASNPNNTNNDIVLMELDMIHRAIIEEAVPILLNRRRDYEAIIAHRTNDSALESHAQNSAPGSSFNDDSDFVAPESVLTLSWSLWMRLIMSHIDTPTIHRYPSTPNGHGMNGIVCTVSDLIINPLRQCHTYSK